jgi:hypothetical protein
MSSASSSSSSAELSASEAATALVRMGAQPSEHKPTLRDMVLQKSSSFIQCHAFPSDDLPAPPAHLSYLHLQAAEELALLEGAYAM